MPAFYPPVGRTTDISAVRILSQDELSEDQGTPGSGVSLVTPASTDQLYKPLMALDRHMQGITDLVFDNNNNNDDTVRELDAAKNALGAVQ